MELQVKAAQLEVCYGKFLALSISSLSLSGTAIGVVGPNGSGKSTFIKTMLGILEPRNGELRVYHGGRDKKPLNPEASMAYSPEDGAVFADLSVDSYLRVWGRIKFGNSRYYLSQGRDVIDALELAPLLGKKGRELSKGQRRRVQTAVGLLLRPKCFCFDEPFDGLDIAQSLRLADILQDQRERMGIVVSSHRMDVVERLVDSIIVLDQGKIRVSGSLFEVIEALLPTVIEFRIDKDDSFYGKLEEMRREIPNARITSGSDGLVTVYSHHQTHDVLGATISGLVSLRGVVKPRPATLSEAMSMAAI